MAKADEVITDKRANKRIFVFINRIYFKVHAAGEVELDDPRRQNVSL
jgi:hypothetical protein